MIDATACASVRNDRAVRMSATLVPTTSSTRSVCAVCVSGNGDMATVRWECATSSSVCVATTFTTRRSKPAEKPKGQTAMANPINQPDCLSGLLVTRSAVSHHELLHANVSAETGLQQSTQRGMAGQVRWSSRIARLSSRSVSGPFACAVQGDAAQLRQLRLNLTSLSASAQSWRLHLTSATQKPLSPTDST